MSFSLDCTGMSVYEGMQKGAGGVGGEGQGAQVERQEGGQRAATASVAPRMEEVGIS